MICYVLFIAEKFPLQHKRKGDQTNFYELILRKHKLHTVRANYEWWEKRFIKIYAGKAYLSLRMWSGKPYRSKQIELLRLDRSHGVGLQKLGFIEMMMTCKPVVAQGDRIYKSDISNVETIATNDGLLFDDFQNWFKDYDLSKDMAILHFTEFRYKEEIKPM